MMDRNVKLHQREFEVLPETWGLLTDAFYTIDPCGPRDAARLLVIPAAGGLERISIGRHRYEQPPSPFPLPPRGERVEKGWRGQAEPCPELGEGGATRSGIALEDRRIADLPALLRPGDLLVFNDTKVIPARLVGHRGEAAIEITLYLLEHSPSAASAGRR